jgi:DDE_Tnp_1-associated/Transposase DDE domain
MRLFDGRNRRRGAMPEHITIPALVEYLAQIPEYRAARGKQHPLLALLLLICVAMLCGARSQSAIADWGRHHGRGWLRRLGFTANQAPSQPTLSRLFQHIPHRTVEAVLGRWAEQALRRCPLAAAALEGIAIDGKTLRGSKRQGAADAHLLSAFSHRAGLVLGQTGVADRTTEIGAARDFLLALVLEGRVVTADALLTQRELARTILASGGDYLMVVKGNQPTLHEEVVEAFAPEVAGLGAAGRAGTVAQHGDRVESRQLTTATVLAEYSAWPGVRQALRLERHTLHKRTGRVQRHFSARTDGD